MRLRVAQDLPPTPRTHGTLTGSLRKLGAPPPGDRSAAPPYAAAHERSPSGLDRRPQRCPRRALVSRRSRPRDRAARGAQARQAAAARGRGGGREDRGREDARRRPRGAPDPAPVLRGHRRRARALRLELRAPDALHPHARGGRRRERGAQGGLRARLPGAAAAARRDRVRRRRPARAAGRRDRPRRRRVRGLPARAALRLPDHDPRDRHHLRQAAPGRDPDLEPHARAARRAQAALHLPLDRPPVAGARDRDRACARARRARGAGGRGRRVRGAAAHARPGQGPGRRRDARLDAGARRARPAASWTPTSWTPRSAPSSSTTRTCSACATTACSSCSRRPARPPRAPAEACTLRRQRRGASYVHALALLRVVQ